MAVHGDTANVHSTLPSTASTLEPYRAVSPFREIKLNRAMRRVELAQW